MGYLTGYLRVIYEVFTQKGKLINEGFTLFGEGFIQTGN
jgi:hypothetical protein